MFYLYSLTVSAIKRFVRARRICVTTFSPIFHQNSKNTKKREMRSTKISNDRGTYASDNRSFCQFSTWFGSKVWVANNEAINTNGKEMGLEWRELFLHFFTLPSFYLHLPFCSAVSWQLVSSLSTSNDRYILFKVIVYLVILTDCFSVQCTGVNFRIFRRI